MDIPYNISREELRNIKFKQYLPERIEEDFRMSDAERRQMRSDFSERRNRLFHHLIHICTDTANKANASNTAVYISTHCYISESLFRRVMYRRDRTLSADFIGRICVGLHLSIEESKQLFEEFGSPLVWGHSAFATVTLRALQDGDSIDDYLEDLEYMQTEN